MDNKKLWNIVKPLLFDRVKLLEKLQKDEDEENNRYFK